MTENNKTTIVVTGASGMVGFHAVKHLLSLGYNVRALVRGSSNTDCFKKLQGNLQVINCNFADKTSLRSALQGADVIVHAAAIVHSNGSYEEIHKINMDLTRNCYEASAAAGLKQFIQISSLSVITGQKDHWGSSENAPYIYTKEAYADSKIDTEKYLLSHATSNNGSQGQKPAITILRPGFIYGPMERAWLPHLIDSLSHGQVVLIDKGMKKTNVIYVDNLCKAIELSILNNKTYGQIYNLTDSQTPLKKELFACICNELNLPPVKKKAPGFIAKRACAFVSAIMPYLPDAVKPKLSRFSNAGFRLAGLNQDFDISKAEKELAYTNLTPFSAAMPETLKSFKS